MNLDFNDYSLENLGKVNVLLGKNGSGKSRLLRQFDEYNFRNEQNINTKYITPERGGTLKHEPNIERNMNNDERWLPNQLRNNQYRQFRQQSVLQFRKLETLVLREIESDQQLRQNMDYTFDTIVESINNLLENIWLKREGEDFEIYLQEEDRKIGEDQISSGESEIISLSIESLVFQKEAKEGIENFLLFDEPDVHLHPDLQSKFARFLVDIFKEEPVKIIIATHSTALLSSLRDSDDLKVGFIKAGENRVEFESTNEIHRTILPIFGAHPLSNVFNESPIFLVEGEDDLRIWQQALRTSQGEINIHPCPVDSIVRMNDYETLSRKILSTVYDNAVGYSLRDKDEVEEEEIEDLGCIKRFRLSCRAAENLLLTDEVLERLNTSWEELRDNIFVWIENNEDHPHFDAMCNFRDNDFSRKETDLKDIRNDLMGLIGSNKPWEIAIGQTIGLRDFENSDHSITNYLGNNLVNTIIN
ncbi:AAA family ATPase [Fodinibius sediminis]|uniref:Energy-coupling factor transporter ATP-binding protein EcfA2 n=1 Tax=Fodinibius sediminis TaxID=1214077 RepID=A0A521E7M4_9BACT|nr:AAA family ATPase [Fodinibius sediminis]SMO79411.1 Energy-coupling factor transporter ATP-binding protein EcfA2 [Fodinibius sediminis]